jgi:signal peptidase I
MARYTALAALVLMQAVFIYLPSWLVVAFNCVVRPLVYAVVCIVFYVFTDSRPVPKRGMSVVVAGLGVMLYFMVLLSVGVIYGFGRNVMISGFLSFAENLWIFATVVVMSEFIRCRFVKGISANQRPAAAVLTLVYVFVQLGAWRNLLNMPFLGQLDFVITTFFPILMLNAVLTFMAFESSLLALLILRSAFSLAPLLLPILPKCPEPIWSAVTCAVLFLFTIFYHIVMKDRNKQLVHSTKRYARHNKKIDISVVIPVLSLTLLVAFGLRVLPYFPAVVITGSMTGAIDRGSVVFMKKLRTQDIYETVKEGDVIHFKNRDMEMIHRVIEFKHNPDGERFYVTQGDANPVPDTEWVSAEQITGISKAHLPYVGYPFIQVWAIFER